MNSVVGDLSKQQSNDFTKIQARFANRLKLTSADVAEVIQKRLLTKNPFGQNCSRSRIPSRPTTSRRCLTSPTGAAIPELP
jgi:hypothetical protein